MRGLAALQLAAAAAAGAGDGGLVLPLPMLGWSTWETFACHIDSTLLEQSIRALAASPLKTSGYNWILIDDCWTTCKGHVAANGLCSEPGDRDAATGWPVPDAAMFPNGFQPLTGLAHRLGLKVGIYTSVSAATCAGYTGSFGHEAADAAAFVEWGFDMIKHDTCGRDYGVHDGGLQNATERMRDGIWAAGLKAGRKIVYFLDSGNPTSPQRVFNPYQHGVPAYADAMEIQQESLLKLATKPEELVWVWATKWGRDSVVTDASDARGRLVDDKGPHMYKSWFDRQDSWQSVLTNAANQVRIAEYQRCSQLHMPDYLTVNGHLVPGVGHGSGHLTHAENRAQFLLWVILGSPLIMGNDIRKLDNFTVDLVTSPEVLAVNQDPQCIQGSMVRADGPTETWIKPLSDGSFAVLLLNKVSRQCAAAATDSLIVRCRFRRLFDHVGPAATGQRREGGECHCLYGQRWTAVGVRGGFLSGNLRRNESARSSCRDRPRCAHVYLHSKCPSTRCAAPAIRSSWSGAKIQFHQLHKVPDWQPVPGQGHYWSGWLCAGHRPGVFRMVPRDRMVQVFQLGWKRHCRGRRRRCLETAMVRAVYGVRAAGGTRHRLQQLQDED
eukprot:SAG22_NODE_2219_length_2823_cov_1.220999_2_plen_610_part_00